jgi:hypothetical protein
MAPEINQHEGSSAVVTFATVNALHAKFPTQAEAHCFTL